MINYLNHNLILKLRINAYSFVSKYPHLGYLPLKIKNIVDTHPYNKYYIFNKLILDYTIIILTIAERTPGSHTLCIRDFPHWSKFHKGVSDRDAASKIFLGGFSKSCHSFVNQETWLFKDSLHLLFWLHVVKVFAQTVSQTRINQCSLNQFTSYKGLNELCKKINITL